MCYYQWWKWINFLAGMIQYLSIRSQNSNRHCNKETKSKSTIDPPCIVHFENAKSIFSILKAILSKTTKNHSRLHTASCTSDQCWQLVYINQICKFGMFLKWLVENVWCGIYEKFDIVLLKGLVKTVNQIIWYFAKRKERKHCGVTAK